MTIAVTVPAGCRLVIEVLPGAVTDGLPATPSQPADAAALLSTSGVAVGELRLTGPPDAAVVIPPAAMADVAPAVVPAALVLS